MRALLIGRFQPFHKGHLELVKRIFNEGKYELIIGIGSAQESYTPSNPFTAGERYSMIDRALEGIKNAKYCIIPIPDINRYGIWVSHVEDLVPPFDVVLTNNPLMKELFSREGYKVTETPLFNRKEYSSTEIRKRILNDEEWESLVPREVAEVIKNIKGIERIKNLAESDR
jgi:nicotinamide-nucleotide adenylyltransferase